MLVASIAAIGCSGTNGKPLPPDPITPANHKWFPITVGAGHELGKVGMKSDGPLTCEQCHDPGANDFTQFSCTGCHKHAQPVTDRLHGGEKLYSFNSEPATDGGVLLGCITCHKEGARVPYDHIGIDKECAQCHDIDNAFAALPVASFTHPTMGGSDCGACHVKTTWLDAGMVPSDAHDPSRDIYVDALIPTWAGTSITQVTAQNERLTLPMNHATTAIPAAALSACSNCHENAATGQYFPGDLHSSLSNLKLPQPTVCSDCHASTIPTGFVGPLAANPARIPASGEMRHEAVVWTGGVPGTVAAVPFDCGVCHKPPSQQLAATWGGWQELKADGGVGATGSAGFHASLRAASKPAATSCIDCHANTRASSTVTVPPLGILFDHTAPSAQGDCAACHASSAAINVSWTGGVYHAVGSTTPTTCLPCHAAERPIASTTWTNPTFKSSPFDYVTNSSMISHGDAQDCAACHNNAGTGTWGSNQNWAAGHFNHTPTSVAANTCVACHTTQRPDLNGYDAGTVGFDHVLNGNGDCFGCHQATVTANTYAKFTPIPGGDWKGGQLYPGSVLVSSVSEFIKLDEITLNKTGALVTSTSTINATLFNGMLHTSASLPAALNAGPSNNPDYTKCWHCHTNTAGTVTAYSNGKYHAALTNYAATFGGTVVPFPQPTNGCTSCHSQMRPAGIVEKAASTLQPMDHSAAFTAAVMIGGVSVTSVTQVECGVCHTSPGTTWTDGKFHANIGAAVPADCNVCHYPVMADAAKADVTTGTTFAMRHRSPQITFQACQTCHTGALAKGATTPIAATLWKTGAYHNSLTAQPSTCVDCHTISVPGPTVATQSSISYSLPPAAATTTNQGQWMSHGSTYVTGKDCAVCHLADAKKTGSAWSKADLFHTAVTNPTVCNQCHGTTNGGGGVLGTNNNLPTGLTNSTMVSTAAANAATGIPAGTLDQISHADINVASKDCALCHTQKGASTAAGVQGKEWAQAKFHVNFTTANPLLINGTSGRCSTCHMNVKPTAAFTQQAHAAYTAASGTTDCSSCHSIPGTGTLAAPNWLGATGGVPTTISVGGFTVSKPPAANSATIEGGIANLPHPTVGAQACSVCHPGGIGGKQAIGYDHLSTLINSNCNACHEAGSNLVGTVWNGATVAPGPAGAGDTRPFTLPTVKSLFKGNSHIVPSATTIPSNASPTYHFYPTDCKQCHTVPAGNGLTTSGAAYSTQSGSTSVGAWRFPHTESKMTNPTTCQFCHGNNIPN